MEAALAQEKSQRQKREEGHACHTFVLAPIGENDVALKDKTKNK